MPSKRDDDPEAHTRRDPEASSSQQPELPLAGGDETEDDEEPPGVEESDGESTVDYRNFDDNFRDLEDAQEDEDDENTFIFDREEFFLSTSDVPSTNA